MMNQLTPTYKMIPYQANRFPKAMGCRTIEYMPWVISSVLLTPLVTSSSVLRGRYPTVMARMATPVREMIAHSKVKKKLSGMILNGLAISRANIAAGYSSRGSQ